MFHSFKVNFKKFWNTPNILEETIFQADAGEVFMLFLFDILVLFKGRATFVSYLMTKPSF